MLEDDGGVNTIEDWELPHGALSRPGTDVDINGRVLLGDQRLERSFCYHSSIGNVNGKNDQKKVELIRAIRTDSFVLYPYELLTPTYQILLAAISYLLTFSNPAIS